MTENPRYESFLPDFCGTRIVFVVILVAELLALTLSLDELADLDQMLDVLAINSLFIQWIALSCVAALCLSRRYLNHLPDHWVATLSYLITLASALLVIECAWWVFQQFPGAERYIPARHSLFLIRSMGISAVVSALALRYFYVLHQWRVRIKSEADARFQALQSRIHPHFLFNCMNTIASHIRRQPAFAEQAVEDLADLFRASLGDARRSHTLHDEIELCRRYLRIEQQRLGERLTVDWQLDGLPGDLSLPALCLQPLLENAIYHGIEQLPAGGTIRIHGGSGSGGVTITIENPVPPSRHADRHQPGHRLALDNINQRLEALYGQTGLLQIRQQDDHYTVTLNIPRS